MIPVHQVKGAVASGPVDLVIEAELDRRQLVVPVLRFALLMDTAAEHLLYDGVEALHLALRLGMVGGGKA